jgi:hypothetical protein
LSSIVFFGMLCSQVVFWGKARKKEDQWAHWNHLVMIS